MAEVSLRAVDDTNRDAVAALRVAPGQERYVDSAASSLAEAASHTPHPWLRAIYADDRPVGLLMLAEHDPAGEWPYFLWRLLIDQEHQGHGYAHQALALVIDHLRSYPDARELVTSVATYDDDTDSPMGFYERLGFVRTGAFHGPEEILKRPLAD